MGTKETTKKGRNTVCADFADNWSVIGYKYTYYDTGFRKFSWIVLLLAATAFAVYLFYGSVVDYVEYSSYNVDNVDYDVHQLDFPTITICNINSLNMKKAQASRLANSVREFTSNYGGLIGLNQSAIDDQWFVRHGISTAKQAINLFVSNYDDMTRDDIVRSIRPASACMFNSKPCNRTDITTTMSWETSACQQFNSFNHRARTKKSFSVGMRDGLDMVFNIDTANSMISSYPFQGLELLIHPFGTPHFIQEYTDVVIMQPGIMNIITVDPVKVTNLPSPFSTNCEDSIPFKVIKRYPYSKAMCEVDCILKDVYDICNCVGFEFEGYVGDIPICTIKQMGCYLHYKTIYKDRRPQPCKKTCPLGCSTVKYGIRQTQSAIGNNDIFARINQIPGWKGNYTKDETIAYIKENIVGLVIGFKAINEQTSVVTASVTWTSLLGEIGGNLGLCMGLSLLTVLELLYFMYDLIRYRKNVEPGNEDIGNGKVMVNGGVPKYTY